MKPNNASCDVVWLGNGQTFGALAYACLCLLLLSIRSGTIANAQDEDQPEPEVLITVSISPEARVKASPGSASRVLRQGEWTEFTVTIENTAGITSPLVIESEQQMRDEGSGSLREPIEGSGSLREPVESSGSLREPSLDRGAVHDADRRAVHDPERARWMRLDWDAEKPLTGAPKETRRLRIWSRDHGVRSAVLNFNAGQGTQDLGFRSDVLLSFRVLAK
ncbi:MAG: hypothetical protein JNK57_05530 [Planctomycetaceae bacterium]|nr:hypothetical protein [Planctomycetaceae bacterium]